MEDQWAAEAAVTEQDNGMHVMSARGRAALRSLFCSCPPDHRPIKQHLAILVAKAEDTLADFTDSTIVYIIAKQWADLLSIYTFRLHARPFCAHASAHVCGTEAAGWIQLLYALGLLLVLAVVVRAAYHYEHKLNSLRYVPIMAAQCVGWSLGSASVQLLTELDNEGASLAACITCNYVNMGVSAIITIICAVITVVIQPLMDFEIDPNQPSDLKISKATD